MSLEKRHTMKRNALPEYARFAASMALLGLYMAGTVAAGYFGARLLRLPKPMAAAVGAVSPIVGAVVAGSIWGEDPDGPTDW